MIDVIVESAREIMNEPRATLIKMVQEACPGDKGLARFKHDLALARIQSPILDKTLQKLLAATESKKIMLLLYDEEIRRNEHATPVFFLAQILECRLEQQQEDQR